MYKDLSLKEKAKVLLYGSKLGLTSVEDIAKLYDDAIGHKFLGDTESQMNNSSGVLKWNEELLDFVYSVPEVTVAYDLPKRNEDKSGFDKYVQSITNSYINGNINTNDVNKLPWLYRNAIIGLSSLSKGLEMTKSYNQKVREEFRELSNIPNKKKIKRSWLKTVYGDNRDYNDIPAAIDNIAEAEKYNTEVLKKEKQLDNWLSSNAGKLLNAYIPFFDPFKGDMTDMPSQAYRYYLRHFKNDDEYISGNGTDIVSLNDNVIRLTPTSNQSTALFNEFVERANPSVRKASDYKNNNVGTFGDRNIPIQNISLYQGIENGVFKVAPIEQFNDSTDVYPVRNIRKAFSAPIKNIDVSFDVNPTYPNSAGINYRTRLEYKKISNDYKTTFNEIALDNIDNLIEEAELIKDTKLVDKLQDFKKTGKYKSFYGLEYDLSDLPSYSNISDKAFSGTKSLNKQYFEQIDNELILLDSIFQEKQKQYPSLFRDDFGTYTWYYNNIKDKLGKYNVTDVNDSTYNISNLNAAILDNKMVLGNPNGGVFIGKFLDISKPLLDSLNAYLLKNPSWLARPDLGSFDQYRLDSPSLGSYLRQYFEHPDQNDPNVFVVGTTQPNELWSNSYAKGGKLVLDNNGYYTNSKDKDILIQGNSTGTNITMKGIPFKIAAWDNLGNYQELKPNGEYYFPGSMVREHALQLGGNTKPTFDLWYPTVPKQKNDTSSYDLRRAYNTLPFEEMENFRTIDNYHLPSVAYDEKTDTYTFLKRNGHPTLKYELDWYNSGTPDALEFRERYKLDTLSLPWRYIPNYAKGGSIHIKPENRGKFTALKKRTGHSASWFKAHGTPALKKMATFALNARHWKHDDGGHLFLGDNSYLLTLFDKYGPNSLVIQINKPVRLNEVQVVADAPKPGDFNYDKYIANTYDAWKRGDVDINTLPTETRNRVRGYSGTIAALKGMDTAAKVAGITAAVPAGIIGGISSIPYLYNLVTNPVGLKLTKQLLASEIGGRSVDLTSLAVTGKSWNENIGNLTYNITGWNPNNSMLGLVAVSFTNPGYMGLEGAKSLGKSIAHGWNNKLNDLQFKYGVNKFVENTEYPTYQVDNLTNYRSNVKTRKVIDRVIKDNPNLSYEQKQLLRYAAKNMAYTNNVDSGFGTYLPINDRLDGSNLPGLFYPDNKTRLYQINVPKYDSWSNTHEIGHVVDDVAPGKFSSRHGVIPEYMYDASGQENKVELFADIFANTYSKRKPHDYLTHKPGLAESLKNRVDITKEYSFDEGFQNIIDKETGKILNDPHPNRYLSQQLNIINPKATIVHTLDEAPHGLFMNNDFQVLIKPLAEGADIERLLSKTGTISRNSLDAYIKKQGKFYQDVMNDVLNSDFSGIDKINYNDFRNAVSKKLPEYKRIPLQLYKDYGFQSLGYKYNKNINEFLESINKYGDPDLFEDQIYTIQKYGTLDDATNLELLRADVNSKRITRLQYVEGINDLYKSMKNRYLDIDKFDLSTFTFESPGIKGNTKHYQGNPIGHSRTYTTTDEPDVLHVMESQSDWALNLNAESETISKPLVINENGRTNFIISGDGLSYKVVDEGTGELYDVLKKYDKNIDNRFGIEIKKYEPKLLEKHMVSEYIPRQIQENLKFAALRGLKKMRYPTRETAAKIELYPETRLFDRTKYTEYLNNYREQDRLLRRKYNLPEEGYLTTEEFESNFNPWDSDEILSGSSINDVYNRSIKELEKTESSENYRLYKQEISKLKTPELWMEELPMGYDSKYEAILKKYSDFPKQYRKLFKDADIRTITDSKGNTWYEVDIPEKYQKGKAEILMNLAPYLGLGIGTSAFANE